MARRVTVTATAQATITEEWDLLVPDDADIMEIESFMHGPHADGWTIIEVRTTKTENEVEREVKDVEERGPA